MHSVVYNLPLLHCDFPTSIKTSSMPDLSTVVRRGHPIAFGIFAILAFIVAVIASATVADFNKNGNPPASIRDATRFLVFAGWWGFLFTIAYVRTTSANDADPRLFSS